MSRTLWGSGQSWMAWILFWAIMRPSGDSIYPRYSHELQWNSHLLAQAYSQLHQSRVSTSRTWAECCSGSSEYTRISSRYMTTEMSFISVKISFDIHEPLKTSRSVGEPLEARASLATRKTHIRSRMWFSIRRHQRCGQGGKHVAGRYWYRFVPCGVRPIGH